jgi:hypothetical protein
MFVANERASRTTIIIIATYVNVCLSNKNNSLQNLFIQIILSLSFSVCYCLYISLVVVVVVRALVARERDFHRLERKAKILSTKTLLLNVLFFLKQT